MCRYKKDIFLSGKIKSSGSLLLVQGYGPLTMKENNHGTGSLYLARG